MTRNSAARLPFELVDHIFAFGARDLPLDVCRHVRALKRALHDGCARRVQQWFRRHRLAPDAPPGPLTKRVLIRYYAAHYPEEYLLSYPEFIVHKCGLDRALLRDLPPQRQSVPSSLLGTTWTLAVWAAQSLLHRRDGLPRTLRPRRRRDVLQFLRHPSVTVADIEYAGW